MLKKTGKYGVINTNTINYTVSAIYSEVEPITNSSDTMYKIKYENFYGVVTSQGVKILPTEYSSVEKIDSTAYVVAVKNGVKTIFDSSGKKATNGVDRNSKDN